MITKLTAENSGRNYAPAFELINQALKAQGSSLEIHSIEDYFNNLKDEIIPLLVNRRTENGREVGDQGGYLLLMPADEEIFAINANNRTISIPQDVKKNGIGVYGDHNAEMLVLSIDRYFDNQDLLNTKVAINWKFTPVGFKSDNEDPNVVEAFVPNADLDSSKVMFGFIIDKNMTPSEGTLTFSVTFYTLDGGEISYSLNTLPAQLKINNTLTLKHPEQIEPQINKNYLARFTNSVYQDNTIQPIGAPVWRTGALKNGELLGLDEELYLPLNPSAISETAPYIIDLANYEQNLKLQAQAVADPVTANISYTWSFEPQYGLNSKEQLIDMDYTGVSENKREEYIEVTNLPDSDLGERYYLETNTLLDEQHTYSLAEIKTFLEENEEDDKEYKVFVRGTTNIINKAGKYSVKAQGRVSAVSDEFEKVLEGAQLKVDVPYFIGTADSKPTNVTDNDALYNAVAQAAQDAGQVLYTKVTASRNSAVTESNILSIPVAFQPEVELTLKESYHFDENNKNIFKNEDITPVKYVYIDETVNNLLLSAKIKNASEQKAEALNGAFSAELVEKEIAETQDLSTKTAIDNLNLTFVKLPDNNEFELNLGELKEGTFCARVINYRNGTYSVSKLTDEIHTSFIAPAINNLTIKATQLSAGVFEPDENLTDDDYVTVIENGHMVNGKMHQLDIDDANPAWYFKVIDNTQLDNKRDLEDIHVTYEIEEVNYKAADGTIEERDRSGKKEDGTPYETLGEADYREIAKNDPMTFIINNDPGYYRIRITTTYHGTTNIAYTELFRIVM